MFIGSTYTSTRSLITPIGLQSGPETSNTTWGEAISGSFNSEIEKLDPSKRVADAESTVNKATVFQVLGAAALVVGVGVIAHYAKMDIPMTKGVELMTGLGMAVGAFSGMIATVTKSAAKDYLDANEPKKEGSEAKFEVSTDISSRIAQLRTKAFGPKNDDKPSLTM